MKHIPLRAQAGWFVNRLGCSIRLRRFPVGTAPEFIVVSEKKGFPAVEQQSLAHCLENMWLKATSLDLGFQLVSSTAKWLTIRHSVKCSGLIRMNGHLTDVQ